jgi:hypothetical protein
MQAAGSGEKLDKGDSNLIRESLHSTCDRRLVIRAPGHFFWIAKILRIPPVALFFSIECLFARLEQVVLDGFVGASMTKIGVPRPIGLLSPAGKISGGTSFTVTIMVHVNGHPAGIDHAYRRSELYRQYP